MPRRRAVPEPRGPADTLPLFSSGLMDHWQLIIPRNKLVVYLPDKEN